MLCPSDDVELDNIIYCAYLPQHLIHKNVCVKVNSGMNRLGIMPSETKSFLDLCAKRGVNVDSVFTHLSSIESVDMQLSQFSPLDFGVKRHALASNF